MAESYDAGETVSAVARRYALSPQQLFAWRRVARVPLAEAPAPEALFVPAVVTAPSPEPAARRTPSARKRKGARDAGVVELEINGVAMRVGRGADVRTVAAVIFWDGTGVCLYAKRLEDGGFRWPMVQDGVIRLTAAQLSALLEGLDWRRVHEARQTRVPAQAG